MYNFMDLLDIGDKKEEVFSELYLIRSRHQEQKPLCHGQIMHVIFNLVLDIDVVYQQTQRPDVLNLYSGRIHSQNS